MKTKRSIALGCLVIAAGVWLSGCRPAMKSGPTFAIWGPTSYWVPAEAGRQPATGMNQGSVAMGIWLNNGSNSAPAFAVWVGEQGGGNIAYKGVSSHTPGSSHRDYECEGKLSDIPLKFHTTDGVESPLEIGGDKYDLAKGKLFLVAKHGAKLDVKQMPVAKLNLQPEGTLTLAQMTVEHFRKLAKEDPDIRAFWDEAAKLQ